MVNAVMTVQYRGHGGLGINAIESLMHGNK